MTTPSPSPTRRGRFPSHGRFLGALLLLASVIHLLATHPRAGEPSSQSKTTTTAREFWSFRPLSPPTPPTVLHTDKAHNAIDLFALSKLESHGLSFAREADRRMLVRRLHLDILGLPPSPAQVDEFLHDTHPDAYERLVDRLLASPHYGERWGRQWLDVAGYADSNGYIRHDSPRPLAYHYRDYVIQSLNQDKPYDQFWIEQLAGDELVNYHATPTLAPGDLEKLIATHFLRNAPDGTDNTEGNEITRVMERYAVLESLLQVTMSAMFGLTIDCARCHNHKFDPIPQRDYYALQAVFYPAFHVRNWVQPKDRWIHAPGTAATAAWREANQRATSQADAARSRFEDWLLQHPPPGTIAFLDDFPHATIAAAWSNIAPHDDTPAGNPAVHLDSRTPPAAIAADGHLSLIAAAGDNPAWIVTRSSFDWVPPQAGDWIQATFDLVAIQDSNAPPATRIGYLLALHDFDDSGDKPTGNAPSGNILIEGNPAGGASVFIDHPGKDRKPAGALGQSAYAPGHNYGVRITRLNGDQLLLQHIADGRVEQPALRLKTNQMTRGGFGFEVCCSRHFTVDNVLIQASAPGPTPAAHRDIRSRHNEALAREQAALAHALARAEEQRLAEPERIAWATDLSPQPPVVPLLKRGDYFQHGPPVDAAAPECLTDPDNPMQIVPPPSGAKTTGRRLAFAKWATRPGSRAAALLARVQADRLWRGHFGAGLVATPGNFGASGARPAHPELLEWLASQLVANGWRLKPIHRQILLSRLYRQSSIADTLATGLDPENLSFSRFPAHRIEAESIRDAMLSAAGALNAARHGPAVDFVDRGNRQIVLPSPSEAGSFEVDRRSIYIRQRRTQPLTFLQAFDQPSPEPNCPARSTATVVAQSLTMLNGEFAVRMGRELASRLERDAGPGPEARVRFAFRVALARDPEAPELARSLDFMRRQADLRRRAGTPEADRAALADFCRMLLATNEFIQLQ